MRTDRELIIIESSGGSKNFCNQTSNYIWSNFIFYKSSIYSSLSPKSNQNFRFLINTIKNDYSSSFLRKVFLIQLERFYYF